MSAPGTSTTFSGYTVLCAAADGSIDGGRLGLFHRDTRVLSGYRLSLDGRRPELVSADNPASDRWEAVLRLPRPGGDADGPALPQDAIEVRVRRRVGPGLTELLMVRNHSAVPLETWLCVDIDADFADVAELGREREQQGTVTRTADEAAGRLQFAYDVAVGDRRVERGLLVEAVDGVGGTPEVDEQSVTFRVTLDGRGAWSGSLRFSIKEPGGWRAPASFDTDARARQRVAWRRRRPAIECAETLRRPFERAADDLFDLRNWELEERFLGRPDGSRWITNAGVPTFTGLFGRDVLTAGWQSTLLGTRALRGALEAVTATQATEDDPWRDAEPGKLIHEMREGPLAQLGLTPRDAYYGSLTTPAMFVLGLSELWHWTGDDELLRRHCGTAVRALEWARVHGDLDGDGFLEYLQRSPRGLRNQGWKDSNEAIRWPDGSTVDGPVATVEEQAFHYLALERLAEILLVLDDERGADVHLQRAAALQQRWDDDFWLPDEGFYALALDGKKNPVRTIASNPGHALGTGIVPRERARLVADRLLAPDLFASWGVRSLSDRHPSYNPFAYHLGCTWPVEQATFALGFKRYGLDEHVDRLVEAVLDAAAAVDGGRLPEALTGHGRDDFPAPVPYPAANVPQAWSASALIQIVQIMLGLYPFAPLRVLAVVRPRLPPSVPELTIRRLRVGPATVDLRFERRPDGSAAWRVERRRGQLVVVGAGAPNDVGGGTGLEALEFEVLRRAPGRLARAARIGLGLA
jgi:glycogen debranching enzyme